MAVRLSSLDAGHPSPARRFLVPISVRGQLGPKDIVHLEGLGQLKNPIMSMGISLPDLLACRLVPKPTFYIIYNICYLYLNYAFVRICGCISLCGLWPVAILGLFIYDWRRYMPPSVALFIANTTHDLLIYKALILIMIK
jgi:hypothetical protein